MSRTNEQQLYDYTVKMMGNLTEYYLKADLNKGADVDKLIEVGICKKLAAILPTKYVEVDVTVGYVGDTYAAVAGFTTEEGDIMTASYYSKQQPSVSDLINQKVSLGVSSRGARARTAREKELHKSTYEPYDPYSLTEDFFFGNPSESRGSKVETLPGVQGLGELSDMEYFRERLYKGLALPAPTITSDMTTKTAKPVVDFKTISSLSATPVEGFTRGAGTWVGIDLAKVDVQENVQEALTVDMLKKIQANIDEAIMLDVTAAASVPTGGWSNEVTNWDSFENTTITTNHDHGLTWTAASDMTWYNPYPATAGYASVASIMESCTFTTDDLDELSELINECQSEVMNFE